MNEPRLVLPGQSYCVCPLQFSEHPHSGQCENFLQKRRLLCSWEQGPHRTPAVTRAQGSSRTLPASAQRDTGRPSSRVIPQNKAEGPGNVGEQMEHLELALPHTRVGPEHLLTLVSAFGLLLSRGPGWGHPDRLHVRRGRRQAGTPTH